MMHTFKVVLMVEAVVVMAILAAAISIVERVVQ